MFSYSAHGLRQNAPAPKVEAPTCERKPTLVRPTAADDSIRATVRRMWGKPLGEIATTIGKSTVTVSRIARELGLPSRKNAPRHIGPRSSERDTRLAEVWNRADLTWEQKARHAGFGSAYAARRRAKQTGLIPTASESVNG